MFLQGVWPMRSAPFLKPRLAGPRACRPARKFCAGGEADAVGSRRVAPWSKMGLSEGCPRKLRAVLISKQRAWRALVGSRSAEKVALTYPMTSAHRPKSSSAKRAVTFTHLRNLTTLETCTASLGWRLD